MSKIKNLDSLKEKFANDLHWLTAMLMNSIVLENTNVYRIILNKIDSEFKILPRHTKVSDLMNSACFFAPGFGEKMMDAHFQKFPLQLSTNKDNANLMVCAIEYGANYLIKYLLLKGVSPNIYNQNGEYPIAIATVYNNSKAVKMLIEHNADINLYKKNYVPAIGIAKAIGAYDILSMLEKKNAKAYSSKSSTKFKILETLIAYDKDKTPIQYCGLQLTMYFFQAIFDSDNQDMFFKMTYKTFEKITDMLIKTSSSQSTAAQAAVDIAIDIFEVYVYNADETMSLERQIVDIANKYFLHSQLFPFYSIKVDNTLNIDPILSLKYAEKAYQSLLNVSIIDDEALGRTLLNLGLTMEAFDPYQALQFYNEADQYIPDNPRLINRKICNLMFLDRDSQLVSDLLAKYRDKPSLKKTLTIYNLTRDNLHNNIDTNTFSFEEDDQSLYALIIKSITQKSIDEDKIRQFIVKFIQEDNETSNDIVPIVREILITIYSHLKFYKQGLSLLSYLKDQYPNIFGSHKNPDLKYAEFVFYEENDRIEDANNIIDYFKEVYKLGTMLHYQYSIILKCRVENILINHGEEQSLQFANQVGDENITKMLLKFVSSLQKVRQQEAKQITSQEDLSVDNFDTSEVKNLNEVTESPIINVSQEDEDIITTEVTIDHKQIHKFHQQLKMKVLPPLEPILPARFGSYWLVNDKKYHTYQADVYLLELNKYGYIDQGTLGKLDSKLQTQFLQAIKKGKIGHFTNTTGVICFEGETVAKIKINADKRLYATEQYENQEGKKLIIFDRIGNHKELDKVTSHGPIKIEYVEGYTCDDSFIETNNAANIIGDIGLAELSI